MVQKLIAGALAGAAGTTALNAVTYADMAVRGRPGSSTPEQVVDTLAERTGVSLGDQEIVDNRRSGLGALMGFLVGVGVGAGYGLAASLAPGGRTTSTLGLTLAAMAGSSLPATALGLTDPRTWSAQDWLSDFIPHLAYGVVTRAAYEAFAE